MEICACSFKKNDLVLEWVFITYTKIFVQPHCTLSVWVTDMVLNGCLSGYQKILNPIKWWSQTQVFPNLNILLGLKKYGNLYHFAHKGHKESEPKKSHNCCYIALNSSRAKVDFKMSKWLL